jgi:hypothetical protein
MLAVVFVLAIAAPAFAQSMTWSTTYDMDGSITLEKQLGHFCNTGAEMKQTIDGEGEMTKVMDSTQVAGKLTVSDQNDWVTAQDALRNLTVTSVIHLCAPPKHVLGEIDVEEILDLIDEGRYLRDDEIALLQALADAHEGMTIPVPLLYEALQGYSRALVFAFLGIDMADYIDPLTQQIWAAQVEAFPGWSGNLHQDFEAANGPWAYAHGYLLGDQDDAWWFVNADGDDIWGNIIDGFIGGPVIDQPEINGSMNGIFDIDEFIIDGVEVGDDYVGNYFNIEQMARTSQGTVKRFIDISSPWSHALAYEDMSVTGFAEISDAFAMGNLEPGEEVTPEWWELF